MPRATFTVNSSDLTRLRSILRAEYVRRFGAQPSTRDEEQALHFSSEGRLLALSRAIVDHYVSDSREDAVTVGLRIEG